MGGGGGLQSNVLQVNEHKKTYVQCEQTLGAYRGQNTKQTTN